MGIVKVVRGLWRGEGGELFGAPSPYHSPRRGRLGLRVRRAGCIYELNPAGAKSIWALSPYQPHFATKIGSSIWVA